MHYPPSPLPLTRRQQEILRAVSEGLSNRELGRKFGISHRTVEKHVQNILERLRASDRAEASLIWRLQQGSSDSPPLEHDRAGEDGVSEMAMEAARQAQLSQGYSSSL